MNIRQPSIASPEQVKAFEEAVALSRAGRVGRVVLGAIVAVLSLLWAPWWVALGVFGLVMAWDLYLGTWMDRLWAPLIAERRMKRAHLFFNAAVLGGGCVYVCLPATGAFSGHPIGQHFAIIYCCATIMIGFMYFSATRLQLAAAITPVVGLALATPVVFYGWTFTGVGMAACIVFMLMASATAAKGWRSVLSQLSAQSRARDAAEAANRAKSRFLAMMSHELRTPLNAVIGYAEIIRDDIDDGVKPARADADRIITSSQHLLSLINEVLDFSRLDAGKLELRREVIEVGALVRQVGEMLAPMAAKNANTLILETPPTPVLALVDNQRLMQCLLNLGSNACKFTESSEVRLTLDVQQTDDAVDLTFIVADTGCGLSEAEQARLFQPFEQINTNPNRAQQGAGLGLAITRNLARMMGGDVSVHSTPGEGSVFTLRIRSAREERAIAA